MSETVEGVAAILGGCPEALRTRYGLKRLLGKGAFGDVYRGELPGTGKPCAVKVLKRRGEEDVARRFLAEAKMLSRFRHPHLIEVYDCGVEDRTPWIAMELVEGRDLGKRYPAEGVPPTPGELEPVVLAVAAALDALHARDVVHRDVKPGNILLDDGGRVILMDLGLALDTEATRFSRTGEIHGTPAFLAPEYYLTGVASPAIDWYALGITIDRLLRGAYAFEGREIMDMLLGGTWRPPPPIDGPVGETRMAALAVALIAEDPAERPSSEAAIRAFLHGEPAPAEPPPATSPGPSAEPGSASGALPPPTLSASASALEPPGGTSTRGLALRSVGAVVVFVLALTWGGRPRPAPPPAPPSPGEPAVTAADPASDLPFPGPWWDTLRKVSRAVGIEERGRPDLAVEMAVRHLDEGLGATALRRLKAEQDDAFTRYLEILFHERKGESTRVYELVQAIDLEAEPAGYWEAHLQMRSLGYRCVFEGPATEDVRPEFVEVLLDDARRMETRLRARTEPWARLVHAEFWEYLARRIHGRPDVDAGAYERASDLALELWLDVDALAEDLRVRLLHCSNRASARLGDIERFRAVVDLHEARALRDVRDEGVRAFWVERTREDGEPYNWSQHLFAMTRMGKALWGPGWLPYLPGDVGGRPVGDRGGPMVVAAPRVQRSQILVAEDVPRAEDALLDKAAVARTRGEDLTSDAPFARQVLLPALADPEHPLREPVLGWPSLVAAAASLALENDPAWAADVATLCLRRRRGKGFIKARRVWHRRPWSALVALQVRARSAAGDVAGAREAAGVHLGHLAGLDPPWSQEEVEGGAAILAALRAASPEEAAELAGELGPLGAHLE